MIISNGEWGVKTETKQLENDLSSFDQYDVSMNY